MALPIRLRLAIVSGALIAVVVSAVGALVYLRLEADLVSAADDGLLERAQALVDDPSDGPVIDIAASDVGDVFAAIIDQAGRVIAATPEFPTSLLGPAAMTAGNGARFFERTIPSDEEPTPVRVLAMPAGNGRIVVAGVAFDDQRAALTSLRDELAVALPIAVILALAAGWLVGTAAMRPVNRMRLEAEAISETDLDRRLPVPSTRDELAALGMSLNRMLERLQVAVERERRLVDDASHELRTPLANLKAELDLALRRARTEPELVAALRSALDETDRLTRLAADLLVLARADRGTLPLRRRDVDVQEVVAQSAARFAGRASAAGIVLDARVATKFRANLDPDRIGQALDNLLDNAIRQTPRGAMVTITATRDGPTVRLSVADAGPGFPEEFVAHAFEPFARADAARTRGDGGVGLGLTIVQAIAAAHGGTVTVANQSGQVGAIVEVSLPA